MMTGKADRPYRKLQPTQSGKRSASPCGASDLSRPMGRRGGLLLRSVVDVLGVVPARTPNLCDSYAGPPLGMHVKF